MRKRLGERRRRRAYRRGARAPACPSARSTDGVAGHARDALLAQRDRRRVLAQRGSGAHRGNARVDDTRARPSSAAENDASAPCEIAVVPARDPCEMQRRRESGLLRQHALVLRDRAVAIAFLVQAHGSVPLPRQSTRCPRDNRARSRARHDPPQHCGECRGIGCDAVDQRRPVPAPERRDRDARPRGPPREERARCIAVSPTRSTMTSGSRAATMRAAAASGFAGSARPVELPGSRPATQRRWSRERRRIRHREAPEQRQDRRRSRRDRPRARRRASARPPCAPARAAAPGRQTSPRKAARKRPPACAPHTASNEATAYAARRSSS